LSDGGDAGCAGAYSRHLWRYPYWNLTLIFASREVKLFKRIHMSNQQSLKQFFSSKIFKIPKYQRSYAWEKQNVRDLFEDIQEALDTKSNHYIGTVVLAKSDQDEIFNIVDGQQRITTIIMFISVIIRSLKDEEDQNFYRRYYIKEKEQFKLTPLERDKQFCHNLLDGVSSSEPQSKSQRFMMDA
jgi:uncharacterized protein with ParB-like and HNH nuclease domain